MKTVFTSHGHDACSVKYLDKVFDILENRSFIRRGHYVFEIIGFNGAERQLCGNLSRSGITLMCDPAVDLVDIIRKEFKKYESLQSKLFA